MKLAWLTDIHLNFLRPPALEAFLDMLSETEADAFLLTGDIADVDGLTHHMQAIAERVNRSVYYRRRPGRLSTTVPDGGYTSAIHPTAGPCTPCTQVHKQAIPSTIAQPFAGAGRTEHADTPSQ